MGGDCPEECDGYSPEHDGMNSQALCLAEPACRRICSELGDVCFGIDMYKYSSRCYLNLAGDAANGCKAQYENNALGSTSAYDFLAKGDVVEEVKAVTMASGVSTSNILRFGPIGFNADAGKYKVCFCDSALLPAGREACLPKRTTASRSASSMCLASHAYWLTPDSAVAHATKCTTVGWHAATMSSPGDRRRASVHGGLANLMG